MTFIPTCIQSGCNKGYQHHEYNALSILWRVSSVYTYTRGKLHLAAVNKSVTPLEAHSLVEITEWC